MEGLSEHLSLLSRFAIAIGFALLLPKAMERLRLPGVLGFILAGILLGPKLLGIIEPGGKVITLRSEVLIRDKGRLPNVADVFEGVGVCTRTCRADSEAKVMRKE